MGKFHYWFSVIIELTGITCMLSAYGEKLCLGLTNPADILLRMGCILCAIGGLYFAKFVNVMHFLRGKGKN